MNKTLAMLAAGLVLTGMAAGATTNRSNNAGTVPGSFLYPLDMVGEDRQRAQNRG
ncbi:MAG: hypothetical protein ABEJ07_05665 [Candidatus Nanohaloarchaea archaeon]